MTPVEVFKGWAAKEKSLSEVSVKKYESLWNAWISDLVAKDLEWTTVRSDDLHTFLQGPAPGTKRKRPALNAQRMSTYTRQRYWRLLRGIYAYACKLKIIKKNPALDIPDALRPSIARKDRQSQVLEPFLFDKLKNPTVLRRCIEVSSEDDWWHVRDRALLALCVGLGLTCNELISLRGMDIGRLDRTTPNPNLLLAFDEETERRNSPETVPTWVIDVMQSSQTVERSLALPPQLGSLVHEWTQRRQRLLQERSAVLGHPRDSKTYLKKNDALGPFFMARRKRMPTKSEGIENYPPMVPVTVHYCIRTALQRVRSYTGHTLEDGLQVAKGSAIIRNTVIRNWLDQRGIEQTVRLAGLRNADSLRLSVARPPADTASTNP